MFNLALQCCIDAGIQPTKVLVSDREGRCDWTSQWWKDLDINRLEELHLATTRSFPEWTMCTTLQRCARTLRRLTFGKSFQGQRWQDPSQFAEMPSLRELILVDGARVGPAELAVLLKLSPQLERLEFRLINMGYALEMWRPLFMAIRAHKIGMLVVFDGIGYAGWDKEEDEYRGEADEDDPIDFMTLRYHTTTGLPGLLRDEHPYKYDLCRYMSKVDVAELDLPWNEAIPWKEYEEEDDEEESDEFDE